MAQNQAKHVTSDMTRLIAMRQMSIFYSTHQLRERQHCIINEAECKHGRCYQETS